MASDMANPVLMLRNPASSCFISYAWSGAPNLGDNEHRAWVYRLADGLSQLRIRAIIDYNFLSPVRITKAIIRQSLASADTVLIVYSDDYLDRMDKPETGVGFEYKTLRSNRALWRKTIPIRRSVSANEHKLFDAEARFVPSFEEGDLPSNLNAVMRIASTRA
jgi:hypothetical protein